MMASERLVKAVRALGEGMSLLPTAPVRLTSMGGLNDTVVLGTMRREQWQKVSHMIHVLWPEVEAAMEEWERTERMKELGITEQDIAETMLPPSDVSLAGESRDCTCPDDCEVHGPHPREEITDKFHEWLALTRMEPEE